MTGSYGFKEDTSFPESCDRITRAGNIQLQLYIYIRYVSGRKEVSPYINPLNIPYYLANHTPLNKTFILFLKGSMNKKDLSLRASAGVGDGEIKCP